VVAKIAVRLIPPQLWRSPRTSARQVAFHIKIIAALGITTRTVFEFARQHVQDAIVSREPMLIPIIMLSQHLLPLVVDKALENQNSVSRQKDTLVSMVIIVMVIEIARCVEVLVVFLTIAVHHFASPNVIAAGLHAAPKVNPFAKFSLGH